MEAYSSTDLLIDGLISSFQLKPHPEGGYYTETYRSEYLSQDKDSQLPICASTAIYFLILPNTVSRLHRIVYDEMWHFYLGGPLVIVELTENSVRETVLGQDILHGQTVQYLVKGNTWFGCYPKEGTRFSFVGCTVSPGFEFRDFKLGDRDSLLKAFPFAADIIRRLT